jgi:copper chaperone CopZ
MIWLGVGQISLAQIRDAGSKMRDEAITGHEMRMYQRHAQDHARVLYRSGQAQQPLAAEKAQRHAKAIRENVVEASKGLEAVAKANADDKAIQKSAAAIRKQHDEVIALCDHLDAECRKSDSSAEMICECCATIEKSLAAAQKETDALLETLGGDEAAPEKSAGASKKASLASANFLITGLHCPPCSTTVEDSLRKTKGVRSVKVDWKAKNATVAFDEGVISAQKVAARIAATPHMMGGDMKYGGWLALKVAGVDQAETAAKAKKVLEGVKGVAKVAIYPKNESVGVAFGAEGSVTMHDLLAALEAAGLKGSSFAESTVKTSFRTAAAEAHDDMSMGNMNMGAARRHEGMMDEMSCPGGCQGMMQMNGMGAGHGGSPAVPNPKSMRPAGYAMSRGCGC